MSELLGTYAAHSKDNKIRLESSSGAIFSLLAEKVLNQDGTVYGVVMSHDCKYAEFARIDKQEDLPKLRGSKYLQARVGNSYQQVKVDLESGLTVLFSGTGCQINGLKGFLGKDYENLYCVDVICHGVPSPKLWREYVHYVESEVNSKLINVNFRCKDDSWSDFGIKRVDANHKAMYVSKSRDPYLLMFLRDYCLRPSCYKCVAKQRKLSDLTLADFWGINKVIPKMNDGKGVSLIILRTNRGLELFNSIKTDIVCDEVSYEAGIRRNRAEYNSAKRPKERNYFFIDMAKMSFEELKAKYAAPTHISLKKKIKRYIKKLILKTPASKFIGGGYKVNSQAYGMLFTFEEKENGKKDNK